MVLPDPNGPAPNSTWPTSEAGQAQAQAHLPACPSRPPPPTPHSHPNPPPSRPGPAGQLPAGRVFTPSLTAAAVRLALSVAASSPAVQQAPGGAAHLLLPELVDGRPYGRMSELFDQVCVCGRGGGAARVTGGC